MIWFLKRNFWEILQRKVLTYFPRGITGVCVENCSRAAYTPVLHPSTMNYRVPYSWGSNAKISTRRFAARLLMEVFSTRGRFSPKPPAKSRAGATPCSRK